jgi:methylase of polypeptide subunit release factors
MSAAAHDTLPPDDLPLPRLLSLLRAAGYRFVTPTPATHARVLAREPERRAARLIDVFGWSLPFRADVLPAGMLACLHDADMVAEEDGLLRSRVRVSWLRGNLYLHSAYPTEAEDSVFFGPDSYRFADFVARELAACPKRAGARIADIGTGAGVGAIVAAEGCPAATVLATDVNAKALRLARVNAAAAGTEIDTIETSGLDGVAPPLDVVMLNPPYIVDADGRTYRDGGGMRGGQLSLDLTRAAMTRLAPGGRVLLYTGSAIVAGEDPLRAALEAAAAEGGCTIRYDELDPDVFGEELEQPAYRDVDRIAVIGAVLCRA